MQPLYTIDDSFGRAIYYYALDNLTSALVERMHQPPRDLVSAYVEAIKASMELGKHLSRPFPSLGPIANPSQIHG